MDRVSYICPSCGGELKVAQLECSHCGVRLSGQFDGCPFCRLSEKELKFVATFIRCRGNIKEVEKELGVSYPTVRARLESLIERLGFAGAKPTAEVLELLEKGEISADEAVKLIRRRRDERGQGKDTKDA